MRRFAAILLLLTCAPALAGPIDFDHDIRPILSEHCYECHGTDKAKGGLRLNDPKIAQSELKSGARAIVPNDPGKSELIRRVKSTDPDEQMPLKGDRLTPANRKAPAMDSRRRQMGKPTGPTAPSPARLFLQSKIENRKSKIPSTSSSSNNSNYAKSNLPLPPTPTPSSSASTTTSSVSPLPWMKRIVSPPIHRIAPTNGSSTAARRRTSASAGAGTGSTWPATPTPTATRTTRPARPWRYRDWVIDALNRDMPFDQFTVEQLAGDLLPDATPTTEGRHRLPPQHADQQGRRRRRRAVPRRGGRRPRRTRPATVWLGLTVGCAQCHDHKYDPITQREYYRLFAFFNNATNPRSNSPSPRRPWPNTKRK